MITHGSTVSSQDAYASHSIRDTTEKVVTRAVSVAISAIAMGNDLSDPFILRVLGSVFDQVGSDYADRRAAITIQKSQKNKAMAKIGKAVSAFLYSRKQHVLDANRNVPRLRNKPLRLHSEFEVYVNHVFRSLPIAHEITSLLKQFGVFETFSTYIVNKQRNLVDGIMRRMFSADSVSKGWSLRYFKKMAKRWKLDPIKVQLMSVKLLNLFAERLLPSKKNPRRILVYSAPGGMGHLTSAYAMKNGLRDHYDVRVITPDVVDDPLIEFGYGVERSELYNSMIYKKGVASSRHAYKLEKKAATLSKYHPDTSFDRVVKEEKELGASAVFVNSEHMLKVAFLVADRLGVPLIVQCTNFGTKDTKKYMRSLSDINHIDGSYQINSVDSEIKESKELFVLGALPARASFKRLSSLQKAELRDRMGMDSHEKFVVMSSGGLGSRDLFYDVKGLVSMPEHTYLFPMRIRVICGRNKAVKDEIDHFLATNPNPHRDLIIETVGFLNEQEMANNIMGAHLVVGKPGGSTVAECMASNAPLLARLTKSLPKEEANADFLQRQGLCEIISKPGDMPQKLNECLERDWELDDESRRVSWEEGIIESIEAAKKRYPTERRQEMYGELIKRNLEFGMVDEAVTLFQIAYDQGLDGDYFLNMLSTEEFELIEPFYLGLEEAYSEGRASSRMSL